MFFSLDITLTVWLVLASALAATLVAVGYVAVQSRRVARARRFCDSVESLPGAGDCPCLPVSVIVYSQDEAEALEVLLRSIMAQDYPAEMEIIVVNEGDSSDIRDTVAMLQQAFPALYLTHTPDGAHSLSRKKLAITLGVKAARHDTVVLTAIGAEIRSTLWLRDMMRHFSADGSVELVIGYAAQMPDGDDGPGAGCRAFDSAVRAVRWLGAAIGGHPFRATEFNVAYTRRAFFRNKGFSRSLNLHSGDDDIFISEIARRGNTAVELGENSIVGLISHDYRHALRRAAVRHIFTESHIRRRPRLWGAVAAVCVPAALVLPFVAFALAPRNAAVAVAAVVLLAVLAAGLTVGWRRALRALGMRMLGFSILPLAATYWMRRLMLRARSRFGRQKRYTWD